MYAHRLVYRAKLVSPTAPGAAGPRGAERPDLQVCADGASRKEPVAGLGIFMVHPPARNRTVSDFRPR